MSACVSPQVVFFLLGALTIVEIMDAHKGEDFCCAQKDVLHFFCWGGLMMISFFCWRKQGNEWKWWFLHWFWKVSFSWRSMCAVCWLYPAFGDVFLTRRSCFVFGSSLFHSVRRPNWSNCLHEFPSGLLHTEHLGGTIGSPRIWQNHPGSNQRIPLSLRLPETNIKHSWKYAFSDRIVSQPSIFMGYMSLTEGLFFFGTPQKWPSATQLTEEKTLSSATIHCSATFAVLF